MKPTIGITMGDPAGIGPEVIVKALADASQSWDFLPIIIGKADVIRQSVADLGLTLEVKETTSPDLVTNQPNTLFVLDSCKDPLDYIPGSTNASCGEHAFQAVAKAVRLCQGKSIEAMVTAPICKESWHLAGHKFDGHTGLLAHLTKTDEYRMMFVAESFSVSLVTTHIPLRDVSRQLTVESVFKTIELSFLELTRLGIPSPKIAVCGLNPHAGENAIFGDEDQKLILPAIRRAESMGIRAFGPFPADTVFIAAAKGDFDLVVAQYHDQGLIPIKLLAFDTAVNLTVGLPIIRTSVDHGTAFDIAGQGSANHCNMVAALKYAANLSKGKHYLKNN
jgi:4-hydroxythreonine-4-phosphate dehydrogenase